MWNVMHETMSFKNYCNMDIIVQRHFSERRTAKSSAELFLGME